MKIAVLLGTSRKNNWSEKVAAYVVEKLKHANLEPILVKPENHLKDPQTARVGTEIETNKWSSIMELAEALVIVTPEYNHGYPGELKLMLDQLYSEYNGKPVLVCAVSDGGLGGARVVESLLPVLVTLGMYPLKKGVYFSRVDKLFDENGKILDEAYNDRLISMIDELKKRL